ncbi:peptidylprolyl isomerase [Prosthecobacter sp.]|uniref:peptidylprolyl isomerase n=1 Tax=Prosthecobacter sp. TaxID=1965333 RepID=UPI0037836793
MARPFSSPAWLWILSLAAVACVWGDLNLFKGPLHRFMERRSGGVAAEVHGHPITRLDLATALREDLWKRHEVWRDLSPETQQRVRWRVLENLVNDHLIQACRGESGPDSPALKASVRRELERMQRQFAEPAEFPARLAGQHLTPAALEAQIRDAQLDEAWIAEKIQPRLAQVSEQDLRAWYDKFRETLRIPQAWHASHLFLTRHDKSKPDRAAEMREFQRQLQAKEKTFAELVRERSEDARSKTEGGDLGWFTQERMPADFIAAVQKLRVGQISEPVETRLGWHLILVHERRTSRLPAFEEVKGEIAALLSSQRREAAVQGLLSELREQARRQQWLVYHAEVIARVHPAP